MADIDDTEKNEELDDRPKSKKAEDEMRDLEKVTDYAEEKEIGSVDLNNLEAINQIEAQRSKVNQAKEEELAKVKIKKEDVELIADQFEIPKGQAELALRQSGGDLTKALLQLVS